MKIIYCLFFLLLISAGLFAQSSVKDTSEVSKVTVFKDARIDILAKVETDINKRNARYTKGFRLFVLKSSNREYAMKVRAYLLQNFPGENVFMTYQNPFIKMKFGDFEEKKEAERVRDIIIKSGIVTGGIYVVADMIELKPDKQQDDKL